MVCTRLLLGDNYESYIERVNVHIYKMAWGGYILGRGKNCRAFSLYWLTCITTNFLLGCGFGSGYCCMFGLGNIALILFNFIFWLCLG